MADIIRFSFLYLSLLNHVLTREDYENKIEDLISRVNARRTTWKAGRNPGTEKLLEKHIVSKSLLPDLEHNSRDTPYERDVFNIPHNFDTREYWPYCEDIIGTVRSQGSCGSCWAVHAASVMSDRLCIGSNGTTKVHLSAEEILSCCSNGCLFNKTDTCGGGLASKAFEFFLKSGVVTENCKPYSNDTYNYRTRVPCQAKCTNSSYQKSYSGDKYFTRIWYRVEPIDNVQVIQEEILNHGPVESWIRVFEDFKTYQSGIYRHQTGNWTFNHYVKIIGWGEEDNTQYWLCLNSWGPRWGELGGLFKFLRGTNHCFIERFVYGATIYDRTESSGTRRSLRIFLKICLGLLMYHLR